MDLIDLELVEPAPIVLDLVRDPDGGVVLEVEKGGQGPEGAQGIQGVQGIPGVSRIIIEEAGAYGPRPLPVDDPVTYYGSVDPTASMLPGDVWINTGATSNVEEFRGERGYAGDQSPVTTLNLTGAYSVPNTQSPETRHATLTGNASITGIEAGDPAFAYTVTYIFKQAASGGPYTLSWPSTLKWAGGAAAPAMPTVANAELVVHLFWTGFAWRGMVGGSFFP